MERPLLRMAYQHFKGGIYVILGYAKEEKTLKEVVIYSSLENGELFTRPLEDFFAKHPQTGVPRFQLVAPTVRQK